MRGAFIFLALALGALPAEARSARQPYMPDIEPLEARGCYAYRGEVTCGSYCYWEANGLRYCQQREREAVPQVGWWDDRASVAPTRSRRGNRAHTIK